MTRSFAPKPQPAIELQIERIVLHGLPLTRGQSLVLQNAVEAELSRLLSERGLSRSSAGAMASVSAGPIELARDDDPGQVGEQIAHAIYRAIGPTPASPRQTPVIAGAVQ